MFRNVPALLLTLVGSVTITYAAPAPTPPLEAVPISDSRLAPPDALRIPPLESIPAPTFLSETCQQAQQECQAACPGLGQSGHFACFASCNVFCT